MPQKLSDPVSSPSEPNQNGGSSNSSDIDILAQGISSGDMEELPPMPLSPPKRKRTISSSSSSSSSTRRSQRPKKKSRTPSINRNLQARAAAAPQPAAAAPQSVPRFASQPFGVDTGDRFGVLDRIANEDFTGNPGTGFYGVMKPVSVQPQPAAAAAADYAKQKQIEDDEREARRLESMPSPRSRPRRSSQSIGVIPDDGDTICANWDNDYDHYFEKYPNANEENERRKDELLANLLELPDHVVFVNEINTRGVFFKCKDVLEMVRDLDNTFQPHLSNVYKYFYWKVISLKKFRQHINDTIRSDRIKYPMVTYPEFGRSQI